VLTRILADIKNQSTGTPMHAAQSKTAIITGGTRGIGEQLAKLLSEQGFKVLIIGRNTEQFFETKAPWKDNITGQNCDLSDLNAVMALVEQLKSEYPKLDMLINNAASQTEMDFFEFEEWQRNCDNSLCEVALNLTTPIILSHALLEPIERANGAIVNISSGLALSPKADAPTYSATKTALSAFSKALRYQCENKTSSAKIIEVIMSLVDTEMTQGRGTGKISPLQAASEILKGIGKQQNEIWIGKAKLLRIIHRLAPEISARILR
jgi:uncharacterized oxidoreductase